MKANSLKELEYEYTDLQVEIDGLTADYDTIMESIDNNGDKLLGAEIVAMYGLANSRLKSIKHKLTEKVGVLIEVNKLKQIEIDNLILQRDEDRFLFKPYEEPKVIVEPTLYELLDRL